jgi:hypothetical protein
MMAVWFLAYGVHPLVLGFDLPRSGPLRQLAPLSVYAQTPPSQSDASNIDLFIFPPQCGGLQVEINGAVTTTDGSTITALTWDWGDGTIEDSLFPHTHQYAAPGVYSVSLTAQTNTGQRRTLVTELACGIVSDSSPAPPGANESLLCELLSLDDPGPFDPIDLFIFPPQNLGGSRVEINGAVTTTDGSTVTTVTWDWGDGTIEDSLFPHTHQYATPGVYSFTLTAQTDTGQRRTLAAELACGIEPALLRDTRDANSTDPFIIAKAAELGNDPERLFAFVRDEIGFESYQGSLRGARGTLWSKAGNALDQASLLIALLRASGIPARYVHGTLTTPQAQQLILSMFPPVLRVVGCPPPDAERADPANDPQLLAETRQHYWVEFDAGSGFVAADPTFKLSQIGQAFTAPLDTFTEVPDALRHWVTIRLKAETSNVFFGGGPERTTVLDSTLTTVEVVGKPLSIGHFVNSTAAGGLIGGSITHTYSPYLLLPFWGRFF